MNKQTNFMNKQICLFFRNKCLTQEARFEIRRIFKMEFCWIFQSFTWSNCVYMMHLHQFHIGNNSLGILTLFISCFLQVYQLLLETENQNKVDKAKKRQKHLVNLSTICYEVSNVTKSLSKVCFRLPIIQNHTKSWLFSWGTVLFTLRLGSIWRKLLVNTRLDFVYLIIRF